MKITLIVADLRPTWAHQCAARLARCLVAEGHAVGVLGLVNQPGEDRSLWDGLSVLPPPADAEGLARLARPARLRQVFQRDDADLAILCGVRAMLSTALPARAARLRTLGILPAVTPLSAAAGLFARPLLRQVTRVLVGTEAMRSHAMARYGLHPQRIVTVPAWPLASEAGSETAEAVSGRVCAPLASGDATGWQRFLHAMTIVARYQPDLSGEVLGEGVAPESFERALAASGHTGRIQWRNVGSDAVSGIAAAALCVLPQPAVSVPAAGLAAQALGRPLIADAFAGDDVLGVAGEAWHRVAPGPESFLADAIDRYLVDGDARASLAAGGRRTHELRQEEQPEAAWLRAVQEAVRPRTYRHRRF